jgi:GTP-binding protein
MGEAQLPFALVFTKADKLSHQKAALQVENYFKTLEKEWDFLPQHFVTSAAKREGMEELLSFIGAVIDEISGIKTF